jgi:hypothetical protein
MNKHFLLAPVIKAVLILLLLLVLLALKMQDPEITLIDSLGLMVLTAFKAIQWAAALLLSIVVSLAFLIAVFLGAVALFNPETASTMYQKIRNNLDSWLLSAKKMLVPTSANTEEVQEVLDPAHQELKQNLDAGLRMIQEQVHTTRDILAGKIEQLSTRIDDLEEVTAKMPDSRLMDELSKEVRGAMTSLAAIQDAIDTMKTCVEQTAHQILEVSPEKILGDLPKRVQAMEEQQAEKTSAVVDISPLEREIAEMQQDLALIQQKADKALLAAADITTEAGPEATEEEHRIFSYFETAADKQKFADLVQTALKKKMSYKHIIDFAIKGMGPQQGKVISSHPSLCKDYIRQCK